MKKTKPQPDAESEQDAGFYAPGVVAPAVAAARRFLSAKDEPAHHVAPLAELPNDTDHPTWAILSALQERCLAFGINASTAELLEAGLLLLSQQTETALEVAMIQSLRADRSITKRSKRR